jgi:hypothetical protein
MSLVMRRAGLLLAALAAAAAASPTALQARSAPRRVQRCGWLVNPTPANWSLFDREGEWFIGVQGDYQAPGLDKIPDLTGPRWVVTNGSSYGYGCVCLSVQSDARSRRITHIYRVRQKPLAACRADHKLPRP